MSTLRLAGNRIPASWNLPAVSAGHFQVVYDTGNLRSDGRPLQHEIEVLSSNNGQLDVLNGHWQYYPTVVDTIVGRPRDHIDHTPEHPEHDDIPGNDTSNVYDYAILRENAAADSAWAVLEQVNHQFNAALVTGHRIPYDLGYNSNSYATTLLYVIGVDINKVEGATPADVSRFPGQGRNALLHPEHSIALNVTGTAEADVIRAGLQDDTLAGLAGDDKLSGGRGTDKLDGGDDNDDLYGEGGNDILSGGWGFDLLDGGKGADTADYSFYTDSDGLNVNLGSGKVSFRPEHSYGSPPAVERLVRIENVDGGGGDDTLRGNAGNNVLRGGGGDDTLAGGRGKDILEGGPGADVFNVIDPQDVVLDFNISEGDTYYP